VPTISVRRTSSRPPTVVVLGDLMLDVIVLPKRPIVEGTDVPGPISLRQGGSAATTARWLSRLGARSVFVTSVGRDPTGRALLDVLRGDNVVVHPARPAGRRTGRIAVLIGVGGERSFVADRSAADALTPSDLRAAWFNRADLLHLPVYSLVGEPLGAAGRHAVGLARAAGALVSVDLASVLPLLAGGRRAAWDRIAGTAPDVLFGTLEEAHALLGGGSAERLLELAPIAIVKRGPKGATVLARARSGGTGSRAGGRLRFEVATTAIDVEDTTGAGDAFDAGFLASWLSVPRDSRHLAGALQRAVVAGHRTAARQLTGPHPELAFG
jgi:sugar/nucleoside kinase (ribokinase family)